MLCDVRVYGFVRCRSTGGPHSQRHEALPIAHPLPRARRGGPTARGRLRRGPRHDLCARSAAGSAPDTALLGHVLGSSAGASQCHAQGTIRLLRDSSVRLLCVHLQIALRMESSTIPELLVLFNMGIIIS